MVICFCESNAQWLDLPMARQVAVVSAEIASTLRPLAICRIAPFLPGGPAYGGFDLFRECYGGVNYWSGACFGAGGFCRHHVDD